jgi:hypothetical protein
LAVENWLEPLLINLGRSTFRRVASVGGLATLFVTYEFAVRAYAWTVLFIALRFFGIPRFWEAQPAQI